MASLARQDSLERFQGIQLKQRREKVQEKEENSERPLSSQSHRQLQLTAATIEEPSATHIPSVIV
jgi:hypothetical protein